MVKKDPRGNPKYQVVIQEDGTPQLFQLKGRGMDKKYINLGYIPITDLRSNGVYLK